MENIDIQGYSGDFYIPTVKFNSETGICEISGESYLEESVKFFQPLIDWVKEFMKTQKPITLNFRLNYFNTSSSKRILELMDLLRQHQNQGNDVRVNWYCEDIEDAKYTVEDFEIMTNLKIHLIEEEMDNE